MIALIFKFLAPLIFLVARDRYQFNVADTSFGLKKVPANRKGLIAVVGKEYCFESTKELPIGSKEEALKAAKLDVDSAPFAGKRYVRVEKLDVHRVAVTHCTVKQTVYEQLIQQFWFVIPEPLLVREYLIREKRPQMESAMGHRQVIASIAGSDFRMQVAYSNEGKQAADQTNAYVQLLLEQLKILGSALRQSLVTERLQAWFDKLPLKGMAITAFVIFSAYLAGSSMWLMNKEQSLQEQLALQQTDLDSVFALQNQLSSSQRIMSGWQNEPRLQQLSAPVWSVVLDWLKQDVEILAFTYDGIKFKVRGKADKATDAIAGLSQFEQISEPESVAPVVKSRDKEIFTVEFTMRDKKEG